MIQASMEESIIFEPTEEVESDFHAYGQVLYKMELILSLLEILFIDTKPGEKSKKKCVFDVPTWWQSTALTKKESNVKVKGYGGVNSINARIFDRRPCIEPAGGVGAVTLPNESWKKKWSSGIWSPSPTPILLGDC